MSNCVCNERFFFPDGEEEEEEEEEAVVIVVDILDILAFFRDARTSRASDQISRPFRSEEEEAPV